MTKLVITSEYVKPFIINIPEDDESVGVRIRDKQVYERHVQALIAGACKIIPPNSMILDIGANFGQHTLFMAKLMPMSMVYAIEGSKTGVDNIFASIFDNDLTNVVPINVLVGLKGKVNFYYDSKHAAHSFIGTTDWCDEKHLDRKIEGDCKTLESLVPNTKYHLIKMDVEGSEYDVIWGSPDIFKSCDNVICEVNKFTFEKFRGMPIDLLWGSFQELGFNECFSVDEHNNVVPITYSQIGGLLEKVNLIDVWFHRQRSEE